MNAYPEIGSRHPRCSLLAKGNDRGTARQAGVFAVEFAFFATAFLMCVFIIMEVSRALYITNTLQEVTRRAARAASVTNFSDANAIDQVRRDAIFRDTSGTLAFSEPITDKHVVIDYLALENQADGSTVQVPIAAASLPGCPARNRLVCTADSGAANCIRFVRVRICQPGSNCDPVPYKSIVSLASLPISLPIATTIVKAESLGYSPGMAMCN